MLTVNLVKLCLIYQKAIIFMTASANVKEKTYKLYRRLLWEVRALWYLLAISVVGSIIYSACDAYAMYLIKPLLNKGFTPGGGEFLKGIALLFLLLFILRGVGSFLSSYFMGKLGANVVYQFRKKMFSRFLDLPANYYDKTSSGKLLSKLLYNVDQVTSATGSAIITVVQDGAFVIGLIIVMLVTSWQLSIIVLLVAPFLAIFITWISKRFRHYSRNTQSAMGSVTHAAEEALVNYREIRIFGGQAYQQEKFDKNLKYTYKQQLRTLLLDGLSSPVVQFIGAIVIAVILFIVASYGLKNGGWLDAGGFVAFFASMMAILKPIKNLTSVNATIQKAIAATEDIFDILDSQPEPDNGTKTIAKVKAQVKFDAVSFNYAGTTQKALNNISFTAESGQMIALVGRSGGGKSTLVNLIARFYQPTSGVITIDGVNTAELTLENLRSHISLVSQHVNLFDDSIYNNIAYGKEGDVSQEEVLAAAKAANALEFIERLPNGFDTVVGQNGFNLSGGQRQRVAIARAILKDAPILLLDEATSALDNESERAVQQALNRLMENRTTFVVAHRLTTVEHADRIIVMDGGEIVETGVHKTLVEKESGLYAKLYQQSLS
ncbi:lipid A export permease/ATP-binding protein MsbA [Fangia hongkongensis]|uniref:lipid A export permease/ATP-binding protein MsbA n=1 Tax=Fangia hongkongensis TaxID=270495 RepID=UPI00036DCAB6|nr:lipid A export permease/ATP-binding protein MsbA [Fangia hongkongensis]MBK2123936.1 lipid A export permease/ATP-binding protein MsbA [Fangia hongkongensis]